MLSAEELVRDLDKVLIQNNRDIEVGERAENVFLSAEDRLVATVESICGG